MLRTRRSGVIILPHSNSSLVTIDNRFDTPTVEAEGLPP